MASLNEVCAGVMDDVDGALGVAVVDLTNGLLLGVAHNVPYFTQSYLDAVAAAAVDMFRGKGVSGIEKLLSQQRGTTVNNSIREIQMSTERTYHFMSIVPGKPDAMAVLITSTKANLGMGWAALRKALPDIAPNCP
jgi:hypothetical protein